MQLAVRKSGQQVWVYRWYEPDQTAKPKRIKKVVGPLSKFSTDKKAWAEVERLGLGRSFDEYGPRNLKQLADHFTKRELSEEQSDDDRRAFSTKEAYRLYLKNWIVPRWGSVPLCDVKAVDVEEWLGKIELAPGSKKKIRDVMHVLYEHAIRCDRRMLLKRTTVPAPALCGGPPPVASDRVHYPLKK